MTKLMDSNDVAMILGVCQRQATTLMEKMEHIDIGTGKKRSLRVSEEALQNWIDSKTVMNRTQVYCATSKIPRKKGGKFVNVG